MRSGTDLICIGSVPLRYQYTINLVYAKILYFS